MNKSTRLLTCLALLTSSVFYSCQKSSKSDLSEAQLCLNTATASSALNCVSKIADNVQPLAYSLRCSAIFISQGFGDASSFVNALDSINHPGSCTGGCSSTMNAMLALSFNQGNLSFSTVRDANNAAAADAFAQCSKADAKIYTQIASIFRLGTLTSMAAYQVSLGAPITETDLKNSVLSLSPSDVGALVNITYANTCQNPEDATDSSKTYCAELGAAIAAGGSEAAIGSCLLNKLKTPAYPCP